MSPDSAHLTEIASRLGRIRGTIKTLFLLDGVSRLVMVLGVFVVATFALDYTFILPREVRVVFLLAGLATVGWIAARRVAYPLGVRISDDDLALFVERHYPELQDRLISALQLSRSAGGPDEMVDRLAGFNSPELVDALVADATQAAQALDFNSVVVRTHVLKIAGWAALIAAVLGVSAAATKTTRHLAGIYVKRAVGLNVRWPQRTTLEVQGFDERRERTIARGDDLVLAVSFRGEHPGKVRLDYKFATGEKGRETLTESAGANASDPSDNVFTYTFTNVPGPFEFTVSGNDDVSDMHRVLTKNPPSIEEMHLFMAYPEYLKLPNTPEDQPILNGNIQAPQYTTVRFRAICNEDLAEATLRLGVKGKEVDSALVVDKDAKGVARFVTGTISVDEAHSEYQLVLRAKNGLPNRDPIKYTIKGLIDNAPQIALHDPQGEENVTEVCERPIVAEVKDDNGIAEIILEWRKDGKVSTDWTPVKMGPEHLKPTAYGPGVKVMRVEYLLNFAPIQAIPGEYVHLRVKARDYKDVKGQGNEGASKPVRFSIVPLTQLEKELQDQLEKVKQNLEALKKYQQTLYDKTAWLDKKYGAVESLNPEQAGEIRYAGNEQSGVTDKLTVARNDIDRIKRRGVWNKIFDERAAGELAKAVEAIDVVIGPRGASPVASTLFRDASKEKKEMRSRLLNDTRGFQSQVITAIDNALRFLDRWSSYQEIVRLVRFALEEQQKVLEMIRRK